MKTKFNRYAALFFALCTVLLVITGCNNIFEPLPTTVKGKSVLILNVSDGTPGGRTIKPDALDFDKYNIIINTNGLTDKIVDETFDKGDPLSFDLDAGDYDIFVEGVVGTKVIAAGSVIKFEMRHVAGGLPQTVNIVLAPTMGEGTGTFTWVIALDNAMIPFSTMKVENDEGAVVHTRNFNTIDDRTGFVDLPSGQYDVVFTLTYAEQTDPVEWIEKLHIYDNLTSHFAWTIPDLRSSTLEKLIEELIRAKGDTTAPPAGLEMQHFELLSIFGLTAGNFEVCMRDIVWVKDIRTSVDVVLMRTVPPSAYEGHVEFINDQVLLEFVWDHAPNGTDIADMSIEVKTVPNLHAVITLFKGTLDEYSFSVTGFKFPLDDFNITIEGEVV